MIAGAAMAVGETVAGALKMPMTAVLQPALPLRRRVGQASGRRGRRRVLCRGGMDDARTVVSNHADGLVRTGALAHQLTEIATGPEPPLSSSDVNCRFRLTSVLCRTVDHLR
jgi:hypothetical protein